MADNGEILRLVVEYGIPAASAVMNVFQWLIEDGATDDERTLDDMEDWTTNVWHPDWEGLAATVAEIIGIAVDVLNTDGTVARNIGTRTLALNGTVVSETGAPAVSAYIKADTALPKTRGSKYIPGLSEGDVNGGFLSVAVLGDVALLLLDYVTPYTGVSASTSYLPGVLSRTIDTFVEFSGSGSFTDVPAYQRRRKTNVGS